MKPITMKLTAVALACALGGGALDASAGMVGKNSGPTTPNLADFSPTFANHPNKVGYNHGAPDGMFLETFRTPCEKGQQPAGALFTIKVKKLSQGRGGGDNDALAFWDNGGPVPVFNTYLWQAGDPAGTVKTASFNLNALPPVNTNPTVNGVINSPPGGHGLGLLSDGDFSFSVQDDTSVLEASIEYGCKAGVDPVKKGMTWGVYPADPVTGTLTVSCMGAPGIACNAYNGDTPASTALPVLCFKPLGAPNPAPNTSDPGHWSGGVVATTPPVSPAGQGWTSVAQVNAYCAAQFGSGWGVAEHHLGNGQGWKFGAYGSVGQPGSTRFWVHINNQPNANAW